MFFLQVKRVSEDIHVSMRSNPNVGNITINWKAKDNAPPQYFDVFMQIYIF
jgi:hypothetical protein